MHLADLPFPSLAAGCRAPPFNLDAMKANRAAGQFPTLAQKHLSGAVPELQYITTCPSIITKDPGIGML